MVGKHFTNWAIFPALKNLSITDFKSKTLKTSFLEFYLKFQRKKHGTKSAEDGMVVWGEGKGVSIPARAPIRLHNIQGKQMEYYTATKRGEELIHATM